MSSDFIINVPQQGPRGLKGETGDPGAAGAIGPQGLTGLRGSRLYTGVGVPGAIQGVLAGDFYVDITNHVIYGPYTGSSWPSGVPFGGPQGPQGLAGATGPAGNAQVSGTPTVGNLAKFHSATEVEDSGIPYNALPTFPAGTKMLFVQSAAPTGWTKDVDQNDKALRIVSGTASTGGSVAFSTVFGKTATDDHQLTIAEMPAHTHSGGFPGNYQGGFGGNTGSFEATYMPDTGSSGGNGTHNHGMDIRVAYVDVIKCTKA